MPCYKVKYERIWKSRAVETFDVEAKNEEEAKELAVKMFDQREAEGDYAYLPCEVDEENFEVINTEDIGEGDLKFRVYVNHTCAGVYAGKDEWDALTAYAKDAGYKDFTDTFTDQVENYVRDHPEIDKDNFDINEYITSRHIANWLEVIVRVPESGPAVINNEYTIRKECED